jgi:hypothetical protein
MISFGIRPPRFLELVLYGRKAERSKPTAVYAIRGIQDLF